MSDFKDMVQADIKEIFLNFDEFGEIHTINGEEVLIIVDENELTEREKRTQAKTGSCIESNSFSMCLRKTLGRFRLRENYWSWTERNILSQMQKMKWASIPSAWRRTGHDCTHRAI
ncbi:MAG: hypothetical protein ACLS41_11370 [Gallintestinimicrobium sp.]|uniref:hypothetical protein n=1 Tax=Gallintestinimicrobium sp. TaxID=2981655 RepID=UPI003994AE2D